MDKSYTRAAKCGAEFERAYDIHAKTAVKNHESRCKTCQLMKKDR